MPSNMNPLNSFPNQNLQGMYPELYNQLMPYINDAINRYRGGQIDENTLESIVEDILIRSGLSEYMVDDYDDDEVIPAQRMMNFGGQVGFGNQNNFRRRRRRRRPWYPQNQWGPGWQWNSPITPQNFIRLLLLQQLWGI